MRLEISDFYAQAPIIPPEELPDNAAQSCVNMYNEMGNIIPIKDTQEDTHSINDNTKSWFLNPFTRTQGIEKDDFAEFVRGPIDNDAYNRVYIGGYNSAPQVYSSLNNQFYDLGIKPPTAAPTVNSIYADSSNSISVAYVITYLNQFNEESKPSKPTAKVKATTSSVSFQANIGLPSLPAGSTAQKVNLYRTEANNRYNLVGTFNQTTGTITDTTLSNKLGEPLRSIDFDVPTDRLKGLQNIGAGVLMAYNNNTLLFCEPYQPHAWPLPYRLSFPSDIRGIAYVGGFIFVTTNDYPWIVRGTHPSRMSQSKLSENAPNLSDYGLVDMGEYALYPSTKGMVVVSANGLKIATDKMLNQDQWLSLNPQTFNAIKYKDYYLCLTRDVKLLFHTAFGLINITPSITGDVYKMTYDAVGNDIYIVTKDGTSTRLYRFDKGDALETTWKSKQFTIPNGVTFNSMRVVADGDVNLKIKAEPSVNYVRDVDNEKGFRLPSGRMRSMFFELKSKHRIKKVVVANSMKELLP